MRGIISISITDGMLKQIDSIRKEVPRSRFIIKLLGYALNDKNFDKWNNENIISVDKCYEQVSTDINC